MARRMLGTSAVLLLLIVVELAFACSAAAADVPPEDKTPETGEELQDDARSRRLDQLFSLFSLFSSLS